MTNVKLGDVVVLNSGGPKMTVIDFNLKVVYCKFFSGNDLSHWNKYEVSLPKEALELWEPKKEKSS